ncbi:MAG: hypothetical protein GXY83_38255 [Rhodopirellula sp.]|nr:hypothetical protein [Rhodopirellula sp.]
MHLIRILLDEHRLIEQVLNCLERMADRCQSHRNLESGPARDAIDFLRGFIQRCHDRKVEEHLLPAIQAMGVATEKCLKCPIRQSRQDNRSHVDAMEASIEPACAGSAAALDEFARHARAYIDGLLDCIARHEDCLFPLIEETARETDGALLESGDRGCGDDVASSTYTEAADRLADRLGVPRAVMSASGDEKQMP